VLSFLSEAREASGSETARVHLAFDNNQEVWSFMRHASALLVLVLLGAKLVFAQGSPLAQAQLHSPPEQPWAACPDVPRTECAGLKVPVDPARPDGTQFTLRLGRVPASDPASRMGVLLFIPGGPGVGIGGVFGQLRAPQHIDEFARQYDVVSFDPRGIGQSSPLRCDPDAIPPASEPTSHAPTPAEFEALAKANAAFFQSCFAATGELMAHLSAIDTAADIERIRQALSPNDGLVAYAGSYGTVYASAYLERYGQHVKALVLDAVVDHSVDLPTNIARNILSVNDAFDRFAQWCDRDSACALHGRDVGTVFDAVAVAAPVTRTLLPQLLAAGRDPQLGWPALAKMLAEASRGDTSTLDELTKVAALGGAAEDPWIVAGITGLLAGVQCADFGPQRDYAALIATGAAVAGRAPRFAWRFWDAAPVAHGATGVGDCVGWPFEATNPPHRLQVGSHPNVMVATGTHDPPTPLINAIAVWLQIPDARLLIADVDGHQSLAWSRCAFEAQLRFLRDPTSVSATTLCPD
jgi:pimeloyl-ACP methyl ester carboxylesterase